MPKPVRHDISLTTTTGGTLTTYSANPAFGRVHQIAIVLPTSGSIVSTGVITVAGEVTGESIWNKTATGSRVVATRKATLTSAGAVFATSGGNPVPSYYVVSGERIKVTVAGGGSSKTATVRVYTDA
jgi:hypothetical protein